MDFSKLLLNKEDGIYFPKSHDLTTYSEGKIHEDYIYQTLLNSNNNSIFSEGLQSKIKDWSSEYHFSPYRTNILRPLEILPNYDILEIGAGTGVITRYLGEIGANVIAVEGALDRAKCIRQRCKDLENVNVICSNVESIDFDQKFDLITLIGVFEYTAKYSKSKEPFSNALEFYKSLLKDSGKLVIAIENKLGLKYFSGYNEDHFGVPYYGLENKYEDRDIRTFGKSEIELKLRDAGFHDIEFMYPFPDYKLPKVILKDLSFGCDKFNLVDLISSVKTRHYSNYPKSNLLREDLVWEVLNENKLVPSFANSFLIVARNEKDLMPENQVLAFHFNCERVGYQNTQITFHLDKLSSKVKILKENIRSKFIIEKKSNKITQFLNHESEEYINGRNLHLLILNSFLKKDLVKVKYYINLWIEFLAQNAPVNPPLKGNLYLSKIRKEYFDCLPSNLILDENNSLHYIDQEWQIDEELKFYYPVFRYLTLFKKYPYVYIRFYSFRRFVNFLLKDSSISNYKFADLNIVENKDNILLSEIHFSKINAPNNKIKSFFKLLHKLINDCYSYLIFNKFISN